MSSHTRVIPVAIQRKTSVEDINEKIIGMLDEIEKRVGNIVPVAFLTSVCVRNSIGGEDRTERA